MNATLFLGILIASMSALLGQTSRGTVTGLVSDPTGAAVAGAAVELRDLERSTIRKTGTNEAGLYRFDAVEPGSYRLHVTAGGFAHSETRPFSIVAAQVATVDAKLEIGEQSVRVEVSAAAVALQTEAPVRGGSVSPVESTQIPNASRNPVQLALNFAGVSTNRGGFGVSTFSVNGARGRSNNFLLDGTENNDISIAGQAFELTNSDAVQEVSVQTGNFDAEFGRAGGAVINTIIRSGTNDLHGSAAYLVESTRLNAITNTQSLSPEIQRRGYPPFGTDQWFSATLGGPVVRNRTFFFGAFQERRTLSSRSLSLVTLSANGRSTLRSLYPQGRNANVDAYLAATEGSNANALLSSMPLGAGRPDIEVGTYLSSIAQRRSEHQPIVKMDHRLSDRNQLSARFAFHDEKDPTGGSVGFKGFETSLKERYNNVVVADTHVFSPSLTNELRLPYNRITLDSPADPANALGLTLPGITIQSLSAIGVDARAPQGRIANNYGLQDTLNWIRGRHQLRFGLDLTMQRAKQLAPFTLRGTLTYRPSPAAGTAPAYSSLANFVDDFGGASGSAFLDFGVPVYYPDMFRQAYFAQDRWRIRESLTVTLGIRYENFGLPMNSVPTPAFAGLFNIDPVTFTGPYSRPNRVRGDHNNFGPTVGLAWSPSANGGLLGWLIGQKRTVWRMGYQIGYDSFYNNIVSNAAASAPNIVATELVSLADTANPRGLSDFRRRLPAEARPLRPADAQTLVREDLVNPYYQRWSAGFQRQLPSDVLFELSYVGSKGTRLYASEDLNPVVPINLRRYGPGVDPASIPAARKTSRYDDLQGSRTIRTNGGSSHFHSLQTEVRRRFRNGLLITGAHTWAKFLDNGSEIFNWNTFTAATLSAVPTIYGGQRFEQGLSSFDRTHRAVFSWVYELPFHRNQRGFAGHLIGGWQVAGVAALESGVPLSIVNGVDADGIGGAIDRPDFNPGGARNVRAVPDVRSATGFVNPDAGNAPIRREDAMYIQLPACNGVANPSGCRTGNLGRNTYRSPGTNNFNATIAKSTRIGERLRTEWKAEFFNLFNHPQFGSFSASAFAPAMPAFQSSVGTSLAGRFLNPNIMDGGGRVVRFGCKLLF